MAAEERTGSGGADSGEAKPGGGHFNRLIGLAGSPFARTIGGFMAYTALGQSVYLLTAPFIGRLFSPSQVGIYGLLLTLVTVCALVVCLYYDHAIPAAASDQEAQHLVAGSLTIALVTCPLFGLVLSTLSMVDGFAGHIPFWSGPIGAAILFAFVITQVLQAWRVRINDTMLIARSNVSLHVVRGFTQVGGGFLVAGWWILLLGELTGRVATMIHMLRWGGGWLLRIDFREPVRRTLRKYREFPLVLLPSQGLDTAAQVAQIAGLTALYGPAGLGQYYLMRRTLDLPVAFVVRSLGDVFYARQAADARGTPDRIRPFFATSVLALTALGAVGALPLVLFGRELFVFVFGENWGLAGTMAAVMAPAAVANLAVAPVARIFNLSTRPHWRFAFGIANAVGTAAVLASAYLYEFTLLQSVVGISAITVASYAVYFVAGWLAAGHIRQHAGEPAETGGAKELE